MSDTNSTSDDSPSLHEMLSEHLTTCEKCQSAPTTPLALGQRDRHCSKYLAIIREWADSEGRANNIVSHDEYGNEADSEYYLKGGKYILGSD